VPPSGLRAETSIDVVPGGNVDRSAKTLVSRKSFVDPRNFD